MYRLKYLAIIGAIALATLACNFTVDTPVRGVSIGTLETYEFDIPQPESGETTELNLKFGAGELIISPGLGESLVLGKATYNVEEFEPKVIVRGSEVEISQEIEELNIIPILDEDIENNWDLALGSSPMALQISAGGYQGEFELGGLALSDLYIAEGAADSRLSFSEANLVEMDTLRYETGASKAVLTGLANANFEDMEFRSGAGDYRLEFSGKLQRDGQVDIKSGLSNLVIVVPEGTAATVSVESGFTNIDLDGDWRSSGNMYVLAGEGPELNFTIEMGAGNLELRVR
jgi:hypothetical protein